MEDKLSLISLAKIYLYLDKETDLTNLRKKTSLLLTKAKKLRIKSEIIEGRAFFDKEEILKILATGRGENKILSKLDFKEIKNLEEIAIKFYFKKEDKPHYWARGFRILLMEEQDTDLIGIIKNYYDNLITKLENMNPLTSCNIVVAHRKVLKELKINKALIFFKIPEKFIKYKSKNGLKRIKEKNKDLKTLPFPSSNIKEVARILLESPDIFEKTIGFLLATGRRTIEVLERGEFSLSDRDNYLTMKGVAKKKEDGVRIEFPVLSSPKILLATLEEIRKEKITYVNLYNYCVSNYKEEFSSPHNLRKLYGAYSYLIFSSPSYNFNLWLSEVLGHEEDDLITSFSYSLYQV